MSQTHTYRMTARTRAGRSPVVDLAVLIEVPQVAAPRARHTSMSSSRESWRASTLRRHRPRRRLRRSVRLAGWSVLAMLPILGGGALGWASLASRAVNLPAWSELTEAGNPTSNDLVGMIGSRRPVVVPTEASIDNSSVVVESIEPTIGAPIVETEVSVIFPGYLLPDDSREEAANEGS